MSGVFGIGGLAFAMVMLTPTEPRKPRLCGRRARAHLRSEATQVSKQCIVNVPGRTMSLVENARQETSSCHQSSCRVTLEPTDLAVPLPFEGFEGLEASKHGFRFLSECLVLLNLALVL